MKRDPKNVPVIPQEILITEVLPRVQANSLVRFRSVCKAWRDVINDPNFIHSQLLHTQSTLKQQQLNLLFTDNGKLNSITIKSSISSSPKIQVTQNFLPSLNLSKHNPIGSTRLWGSCNGLICLEPEQSKLGIWNPCTRSYRPVEYAYYIAFGFGYDAKIKDYKLVGIETGLGWVTRNVKVLEVKVNSWRRISGPEFFVPFKTPGTLIDGVLYWIDLGKQTLAVRPKKLICFDIHEEVFSELILPLVSGDYSTSRIEICEIGGCLALVHELQSSSVCHEVWVRKEIWIKMYTIDVSTQSLVEELTPLGIIGVIEKKGKNGKEENRIIYMGNGGLRPSIFSYNSSTDQFMKLCCFPSLFQDFGSVITYVESLVSVNP